MKLNMTSRLPQRDTTYLLWV